MSIRVYVLHFESAAALSRAFERLSQSSRIGSCLVDAKQSRLRFRGPSQQADRIVERIYLEGEMTWCSRHDV